MQDRPSKLELLAAVRGFLEAEIIPTTDGRRQFLARVAANTLQIVERELQTEEEALRAEWASLQSLLGPEPDPPGPAALALAIRRRTEALCARIRAGDADTPPWSDAVVAHVRATVEAKLRVTNPGLLTSDE